MEFMDLRQGGRSMKEYSLKVTQHSNYAPIFVSKSRARMNKFAMGVSSIVEKECNMTMLHIDIVISKMMVYAQQTKVQS